MCVCIDWIWCLGTVDFAAAVHAWVVPAFFTEASFCLAELWSRLYEVDWSSTEKMVWHTILSSNSILFSTVHL